LTPAPAGADALWESRVFGLTMALHEGGHFAWPEFRDRLIAEIAACERTSPRDARFPYWACWLRAFEELVAAKNLCASDALDARVATLAARPAGHDHERR